MNTKKTLYFAALLVSGFFTVTSCEEECTETTWYLDADGDGFGDASATKSSCDQPAGYVSNTNDVDDSNAALNHNTVWQGSNISFTKTDNADWTQSVSQDRITNNVWLTRQTKKGLFNIAVEADGGDACTDDAPTGTEWAYGSTSDISSLNFQPLGDVIGCNFENIVDGRNMVLYLVSEGIYMDVTFTSWTKGSGGGFSYIRSTKN